MKLFKLIAATLVLTGLAACVNDYDKADHRPAYLVSPDTPWQR